MAKSKSIPREIVNDVLNRSDIVQVAKSLGLELSAENTSNPRVLCAFHPDTRPSMTLYRDTGVSRNDSFYCFACGASGDAISLVKEIKGWDFPTSVAWLANLAGVSVSLSGDRASLRTDRQFGLRVAEELFAAEQIDERTRLKSWAMARKLSDSIVAAAGLRAPNAEKLSSNAANDREKLDGLVEAGLLAPLSHAEPSTATQRPLFTSEFRDFFRRPRILFPIHDEAGELVGYAGRALGSEEPKYLYTKGLKRSAILYRMAGAKMITRCLGRPQ